MSLSVITHSKEQIALPLANGKYTKDCIVLSTSINYMWSLSLKGCFSIYCWQKTKSFSQALQVFIFLVLLASRKKNWGEHYTVGLWCDEIITSENLTNLWPYGNCNEEKRYPCKAIQDFGKILTVFPYLIKMQKCPIFTKYNILVK